MEWLICKKCGCQYYFSVFNPVCPTCGSAETESSGVDGVLNTKNSVINRYNLWRLNEVINKDKEEEK